MGKRKTTTPTGKPDQLNGKPYKDSVNDLFQSTSMQYRDVDQKFLTLLDALHKGGKADAACQHLKTSLDGLAREKVQNWKAYSYKLLRDFDNEVYSKMKEKAAGTRQQKKEEKETKGKKGETQLNTGAAEFVPGQWWQGALNAMPNAYPMQYPSMMMPMAPVMMQPQAKVAVAGAPPPPPAKAAEVPKAAAAEAP